ncbi:MAG TPA: hypothetical protein VM223_06930 [Planctomycetota bacterium]|nr:hypothetical protein [Planctomycetota bacterium]
MSATGGISRATATYLAGTVSQTASGRPATVTEAFAQPGGTTDARTDRADRMELSETGRLLSYASDLARKLKDLPDVRPEVIDNARRTLESGELLSDDVIRQVAGKLGTFVKE